MRLKSILNPFWLVAIVQLAKLHLLSGEGRGLPHPGLPPGGKGVRKVDLKSVKAHQANFSAKNASVRARARSAAGGLYEPR